MVEDPEWANHSIRYILAIGQSETYTSGCTPAEEDLEFDEDHSEYLRVKTRKKARLEESVDDDESKQPRKQEICFLGCLPPGGG